MIAPEAGLSVSRQCVLLGIARSSFYYRPRPECAEELEVLKQLDRIFTDHPIYGSRRLQVALLREGISIGRRRVRRLMRKLGLWAVRPKRNTSKRHPEHKVYPYLLRGKTIDQANQVWAADVTYIPMQQHCCPVNGRVAALKATDSASPRSKTGCPRFELGAFFGNFPRRLP
jgi:putative transposase